MSQSSRMHVWLLLYHLVQIRDRSLSSVSSLHVSLQKRKLFHMTTHDRGTFPSCESDLTISSSNPPPLAVSTANTPRSRYPTPPLGCHYGRLPPGQRLPISGTTGVENDLEKYPNGVPVIWVDFPPSSTENPFFFAAWRKRAITSAAIFFTAMTALNAGGSDVM